MDCGYFDGKLCLLLTNDDVNYFEINIEEDENKKMYYNMF